MQRTWVKFSIWRRKKSFPLFVTVGSVLLPSGSKLEMLGVSRWQRGAPYCLSSETWFREGRVYVCVWVEGLTHTRATPLSADAENMFVWDKSTKTHPSTGSKYALCHCWHGVNNLTLTEVGEACGRMEAGTEREMDWAVIDIQFELLQIFPFSGKMRTSLSAHAVGQVRAIFQSTQFWSKVYLRVVSVHCCRSENKQWPCP